jgi:hypothetical protein
MTGYPSKHGEQITASIREVGQIYQKVDLNLCWINDETTGDDHLLFVFERYQYYKIDTSFLQ